MTTRRWVATTALCLAGGFVFGFVTVVISAATAPTPDRVTPLTVAPPQPRSIP